MHLIVASGAVLEIRLSRNGFDENVRATLVTHFERLITDGEDCVNFKPLLFLGVTSVVRCRCCWIHTDRPSSMPQSMLANSPFHSYLVPGLVLLVCNGLLSLIIFLLLQEGRKLMGDGFFVQGIILAVWLLVEIAVLRLFGRNRRAWYVRR